MTIAETKCYKYGYLGLPEDIAQRLIAITAFTSIEKKPLLIRAFNIGVAERWRKNENDKQ